MVQADPHKAPSAVQTVLAGSLSGMASVLVCHPFDVVRTKMQVGNTSAQETFRATIRHGPSALFQGFTFPFFAQAVFKSTIFCANSLSKRYLFNGDSSSSALFLSGFIAGSVNCTVVAPVEIVRTHQILSSKAADSAPSIPAVIRNLTSKYGLGVLWSGLGPAILRDGPGVGIYLLAFESSKRYLQSQFSQPGGPVPLWVRIASGSWAGITFWTWAIPIDTVKTLIESSYKDGFQGSLMSHVGKQISLRGLYRALPLAYLRGIPSAAVTLTVYDLAIERLTR